MPKFLITLQLEQMLFSKWKEKLNWHVDLSWINLLG